jgi:DNA-binding helix-hairpin-helix protein with protein kinase domain
MTALAEVLLASTPRQRVTLSPRPIGEGGQAAVFAVTGDPRMVVKLYHRPTAEIERRLESMLLLARPDEFRSDGTAHPALTWPSAMVEDADTGAVLGYAMQRVGSPEFLPLGTLFNPMQRRQHFPDISWRFLVGLARNLAGLIAVLHERELVLGDISHANLVVSQRGYLTFLDCDSMQFTDPRSGEHFPCLFLTAEYAPPELQRNERMARSPATDNFSLAILVCRLVSLGDHPFNGIRIGGHDDDADASRNIVDGYSYLVRPEQLGLPSGTLDPGLLPPPVLALGQRAFGPGHDDPSARPSADEWLGALDTAMETIAACDLNPHHAYSDHLPGCPWCARTQAGGSDVFPSPDAPPPLSVTAPSASAVRSSPRWLVPLAVIAVVVLLLLALAFAL